MNKYRPVKCTVERISAHLQAGSEVEAFVGSRDQRWIRIQNVKSERGCVWVQCDGLGAWMVPRKARLALTTPSPST